MWLIPTRPPTSSEWAVLFWAIVVLLVLAGLAGLIASLLAPAEKHAVAVALAHISLWILGTGVVLGVVNWLVRRLID